MSQVFDSIPTTAVDRYLARDDHGNGMVFDVVASLEGKIDVGRLAVAWQETISENPQIFFRLSGRGVNQAWKRTPFSADLFTIEEVGAHEINVRHGVGASLTVIPSSDDSMIENGKIHPMSFRLKFSFHHAACDGVGVARVIYRTMRRYRDGKLPSKTPAGDTVESEPAKGMAFPKLANFWETVRGHNTRLARHAIASGSTSRSQFVPTESNSTFLELGSERSEQIRMRLRQRKTPVNDFGVAAVLHALAAATRPASRRYISIMNPVQTRSWHTRYSTRNHIGFAFIRRRHEQLSSIHETLAGVSDQMNHVRSSGIAGELSQGIEIAERLPGGLSCIDRLGWFVPTASVTCLSGLKFGKRTGLSLEPSDLSSDVSSQPVQRAQTYRAGDATVKGLRILGPLQSRGQLSITIWDTGGGLNFSLRGSTEQDLGEIESVIAFEIEQVVDKFLSE